MTTHLEEQMLTDHGQDLRERWLRCAADLENLRKRTSREIEKETRRAQESTLLEFLDVVDSLERALSSGDEEDNTWYQGMKAIYEQMLDVLRRKGARPFDALAQPFDPHRHDAVACVAFEGVEDGTITEVVKTGYEMEDGRLLRPAEVITNRSRHEG